MKNVSVCRELGSGDARGFCGPLRSAGRTVLKELPSSDLVRHMWASVGDLRGTRGVSEKAMASVTPESWRNRAFRANEECRSGETIHSLMCGGVAGP